MAKQRTPIREEDLDARIHRLRKKVGEGTYRRVMKRECYVANPLLDNLTDACLQRIARRLEKLAKSPGD